MKKLPLEKVSEGIYTLPRPSVDMYDRIILSQLWKDPTQTAKHLAEVTEIELNTVNSIIKSLHERGILKSIIPIINVSKLGFKIFNMLISLETIDDINKKQILEGLINHTSIPWIVTTKGEWSFVIAIFAVDLHHLSSIIMDINNICKNLIKDYEILSVYEEYFFGQRYLFKAENEAIQIEDYWVPLYETSMFYLSSKDLDKLVKIAYQEQPFIFDSIDNEEKYTEISEDIRELKARGILVKFIPTCDIQLLNYEWYIMLVRFRSLTELKLKEFKDFIASFPQITHSIFCIGNWDAKIEMHTVNMKQAEHILCQIKENFGDIIFNTDIILVQNEHKLDFLVRSVFDGIMSDKYSRPCKP